MAENKDTMLIKMLIKTYPYNFSQQNIILRGKRIENNEKLLWKDFILCFKKGFSTILGDFHTKTLSDILRELLSIDQVLDVRSGILLTFQEWIDKSIRKSCKIIEQNKLGGEITH
jgi:hypothetical protein